MYESFVELFLFIHSVIALTVLLSSPQGEQVCLSSKFDTVAGGEEHELDKNKDSSAGDNDLTKHHRAVLEFFIAKIRLHSQKKMKYWAMIPPLGTHSRGYMKNTPSHPLHGAGCSMLTVWDTLNDMFDSSEAARADVISYQFTISMAFDHWQQMVQKIWQMQGSSSNYLKGVAAFVKKDKAILLPIGSVLKSPLGTILFCIVSCNYIDAYSTIIRGELVNEYNAIDDGHSVSMEVTRVTTGLLLWPTIGWKVHSLYSVPPIAELSYVDPIVPLPMNACVHCDSTDDDLLFSA
jgi:hypothetical protein